MIRIARVCTLALLLAALLPAAAHAAAVREYQLQYSPAHGPTSSMLIVVAIIEPAASLPATVTVPAPAGSTLLWSGEVLGGDPAVDPAREATKETVGGMDLYTFPVKQGRVAQIEVSLGAPTISGTRVSGAMTWTNPGREALVTAAVVAEPGATDVVTTPSVIGAAQENALGETLHPLGGVRLSTGGSYAIEVSWRRGGGGGEVQDSVVLPVAIIALVLAIAALAFVMARERSRARRANGDA